MGKIRIEKTYDGKSPDDCYNAAPSAFKKAGFEIFKKREIAWLVIGHRSEENYLIQASIGARPPAVSATVTLSVSCDDLEKENLQKYADFIMEEFEKELTK